MSRLRNAASRALLARAWPLRAYFALLVTLFVAVAAAAVVYVEVQTDRDARRAASKEARFAAKTAANQLGQFVALVRASAEQLAANPGITQVFSRPEACSLSFSGFGGPDRGHIDVLRPDGTVACSSRAQERGTSSRSYAGEPWVQQALTGAVRAAPRRDPATGAWAAIDAVPIPGRKGIVVGFTDLGSAASRLASLHGGGHHPLVFLVTSADRRTVITRSAEPERWIGASIAGTAFARSDGVERPDLDGTVRLYEEASVPGTGWHFFAGQDESAALAAGDRLERRQLAIILVGLTAVLFAAWLLYRRVATPLRRLSDALRSASEAGSLAPIPVAGPAEVVTLGDDVNALIFSVNRELLDRERAEEAARASEQNYRMLFESNPNPMWVFDTDSLRFLAVNDAATHNYGFSRDEFLAMTVEDIRAAGEVAEFRAHVDALGSTGERGLNVAGVWGHRRKDGTLLDAEITSHTHRFHGQAARVVLALDVTERLRAEEGLKRSEARYRDLFENATDLIATTDLDNRLTSVNAAFVTALGYARDELIGMRLTDLVPTEWRDDLAEARDTKLEHGVEATVYVHELLAKDGRRICIEVASRIIEENGTPVGIEAIGRDITERRQLESQLRQAQQLEAIGRLAGGIAHDFNNLLTVIGGYADALLEERDPESEPELCEIAAAAERATILTRQLLAFSRQQMLRPLAVDLNAVVDGVAPMLAQLIGEDIELVTALEPQLETVVADPHQLERVLVNLVVNARDAMPGGGKITIQTGNADLDADYVARHAEATVGPHAMLAVRDTGIGMDAETMAHVFEPFFTTKPVGSGTGLGLSTAYGIVKQSGGTIWAYSEPGKGTTFKVYLPAATGVPAAERAEKPEPVVAQGTETILVAEDEEALRSLIVVMLEQRGYTVLAADDAEDAIRIADERGEEIDLLLTDLIMPQMTGRSLAAEISERVPALRVLYMSGYADDLLTSNGSLEVGASFIEKPFSANDLARRVREALDVDVPVAA